MAIVGGKPTRIFLIGPMDEKAHDLAGLPLAEHLKNIREATEKVIQEIEQRNPTTTPFCDVIAPPNHTGNIKSAVFQHLFHCDIAIADISNSSPNVYYELAILHSLGVPVILLTVEGRKAFYMEHDNSVNLKSFSVEDIAAGLRGKDGRGHLEQLLLGPSNDSFRANPITEFLNKIPLVHFSAVSGIANGQYYNFIHWVLKRGGPLGRGSKFKELIFVRPNRIRSVDADIAALEAVFGKPKTDKYGREFLEIDSYYHPDKDHPRDGISIRYIDDCLIDYPTPISSLAMSKQYRDAFDYYQKYQKNADRLDRASAEAEAEAYELSLIETYITFLRRHVETNSDVNPAQFKVMTVDEIIARFRPGAG